MIRCPKCNGELRVTQTMNGTDKIVRRRKCAVCGTSFLTEEVLLYYGDLQEFEKQSGEISNIKEA